jgi:hypothetical protein
MLNTMLLLAFLVLTLGCSTSYAQEATYERTHPEIKNASLTNNTQKPDDLGTQLAIYALIIGIYALYEFKQRT